MSLPKLSDFMGKSAEKVEYKRVSVLHAINNSLNRNTIYESLKADNKTLLIKPINRFGITDRKYETKDLNYEQKLSSSLLFSSEDLHKLLQHLFNKKTYDINDRNFIRRILLKHFPEDLIYSANKDFINFLQYIKIQKNEVIYPSSAFENGTEQQSGKFYLVLKGKVTFYTDINSIEKHSGEYFGELEIMGNTLITEIHAKHDSMILTLDKTEFELYFLKYFQQKYAMILKRISMFEPLLNLVPNYNQLKIMNLLSEKEFKTGQKVLQKGEIIKEITFINNCEMSSSEDKILNEYKTAGLTEIISMQNPLSKDNVYCMENTFLFFINVGHFLTYFPKEILQNNLFGDTVFETIKSSQTPNEKQTICYETSKIEHFIRVKKVKFIGQKTRFVTEPSSRSISNITPKVTKKNPKYPEYITSFVFLKTESIKNEKSLKKRHEEIKKTENSKYKELKDYFMKTRESLKKKRWLDEMEQNNENSIIFNPEKTIEKTRDTLD